MHFSLCTKRQLIRKRKALAVGKGSENESPLAVIFEAIRVAIMTSKYNNILYRVNSLDQAL